MPNFEGYRDRKSGEPDGYKYDVMPVELKVQLWHIWNEFFRQPEISKELKESALKLVEKTICQRIPVQYLPSPLFVSDGLDRIYKYFKENNDVDICLDIIETVTYYIVFLGNHIKECRFLHLLSYHPLKAIDDTNNRFKKHGLGYQFIEGKIIRVDNNLLNAETVTTTFNLLTEEKYKNVNIEYLMAHEHFRHKRNADCLTWCLKAYESTMKIIVKLNGWELPDAPVATKLVKLLFEKEFFPSFLEAAMNNLRSFMENSINTIRNKRGGHGQGDEEVTVPDSLASFMLYITGATIRLLVETQNERP